MKWFNYSDTYIPNSNNITFALCSVLTDKQTTTKGNLIDKVSFSINGNEKIVNGSFEDLDISSKAYLFLNAENSMLAGARLYLANCTLTVIKNAMNLVLVPYLEKM